MDDLNIQYSEKHTKEVIAYKKQPCLTAWSSAPQAEHPSQHRPIAVPVAEELAAATRRSELIIGLTEAVINRGMAHNPPAPFPFFNDEPRFHAVSAIMSDWRGKPQDTLGALSLCKDDAMLRCLGEVVERYCQHYPIVGNNAVIVNDVVSESCLSVNQLFPRVGIESNQIEHWTQVKSRDGQIYWAPTQSCYLQFDGPNVKIDPFRTTSGTAFGLSHQDAVFSGLCEVIERDALMVHFLGKITPPRVCLMNMPSKVLDAICYMERYNLDVHLFDISLDAPVPTIMALVLDRTGVGPAVSVGASCGRSVEQCIIKALLEAQQARIYSRVSHLTSLDDEGGSIFDSISKAWYSPDNIEKLDFLLESRNFNHLENCVLEPNEIIEKFPHPIYVKSLSPPEFTLCSVVKVLVPDLVPLFFSETPIPIQHERLDKITGKSTVEGGLHPFL